MNNKIVPPMAGLAALIMLTACDPKTETPQASAQTQTVTHTPPYTPSATFQDLMNHIIDPEADVIWNASGSIATKKGVIDRAPKTDEDWETQRRAALRLLEASNLLIIPNRRVAAKPFESTSPGVFSSEEIQQQVDSRRETFDTLALSLRGAAQKLLKATDEHNVSALLELGDALDSACETCHKTFWYPAEKVPHPPANPPSP